MTKIINRIRKFVSFKIKNLEISGSQNLDRKMVDIWENAESQ